MLLSTGKIKIISPLLIILPFLLLSGCSPSMTPAEKWQATVIKAHGGSAALSRVDTVVYRGAIKTRNDSGSVLLTLSRPGRLRSTMRYSNHFEDRILLGNRGWRNFGDGFEEAQAQSLAAMIFQYNHLELPMGLFAAKYGAIFVERKMDGKTYPALELSREGAAPMTVIINPETGLIHRVDGRIRMGDQEVVMGVGYDDYREVADVMLPHRIVNYVNGQAIAESSYDSVIVNGPLSEDVFALDQQAAAQ